MDVGVGVKGYAVIEQGKIGQILSSKPTDRRQLIEEAAGVTKFKSRRRQAELKLEAAQQNLTRVDDLVYELERQRAALKRQAGKARRYQRLRGELRRWEKLLFAQRYERLTEAIRVGARSAHRRARARAGRGGAPRRGRERPRARAHRADRGRQRRPTALRAEAHQRELENERRQQQITFDQQQAAGARADGAGDRRRARRTSRRGADRRARRSRRAARRRRPPTPSATPPARRSRNETRAVEALEAEIGDARSRRRRGPPRRHRQPAVDDDAAAHDRARRGRPRSASAASSDASTSKRGICASRSSG